MYGGAVMVNCDNGHFIGMQFIKEYIRSLIEYILAAIMIKLQNRKVLNITTMPNEFFLSIVIFGREDFKVMTSPR